MRRQIPATVFQTGFPSPQVIYVAPLKALVRERINDWGKGLCKALNKRMVELTGDFTPDMQVRAAMLSCCAAVWWCCNFLAGLFGTRAGSLQKTTGPVMLAGP